MTTELQSSASNNALREKIIKLALETKPTPAIPREAVEIQGAADYIVANAKSEADFARAAAEFEKAIAHAPWNAAFYYNAAVMYEKAKMPEKALPNYEYYLLAAPNADDSTEVIRKVGAMKFAAREADEKRRADEERLRQATAAADQEYQRTAAMRAFRSYVDGKTYRLLLCFGSSGKTYGGCNEEEFNGKNWGPDPGHINPPVYRWEFGSGQAYLKAANGDTMLRVTVNGPNISDLIWEMSIYDQTLKTLVLKRPTGFFRVMPDFSGIIFGWGDPQKKERRQFFVYKTP